MSELHRDEASSAAKLADALLSALGVRGGARGASTGAGAPSDASADGGGGVHIGPRIYVQDGASSQGATLELADSSAAPAASAASSQVAAHHGSGFDAAVRAEMSNRDFITLVSLIIFVIIMLILVYISLRRRTRSA